jgi:hypothetical protein
MEKGWNMMCNIDRVVIDVTTKTGYLFLPKDNCPDMLRTIKCFTSVDPECDKIITHIDEKQDVVYIKVNGEDWHALYERNR